MSPKKPAKAADRKRRTANELGTITPVTRPQPHGGALLSGNPGNVGGDGKMPSVVRARARDGFYQRIPSLEAIADSADSTPEQRISAIDKLGRYGLATGISPDDVRERLKATLTQIRAALPSTQAEALIARIRTIWVGDT